MFLLMKQIFELLSMQILLRYLPQCDQIMPDGINDQRYLTYFYIYIITFHCFYQMALDLSFNLMNYDLQCDNKSRKYKQENQANITAVYH